MTARYRLIIDTRSSESSNESVESMDGSSAAVTRPIDVFISYRRVNGSQLARSVQLGS